MCREKEGTKRANLNDSDDVRVGGKLTAVVESESALDEVRDGLPTRTSRTAGNDVARDLSALLRCGEVGDGEGRGGRGRRRSEARVSEV
jgi:hypothetical protein